MSLKRKVPFIGFMALTIFSIFLLSYTIYLVFGTRWAISSITVSLLDVEIDENKANFSTVIYNPSTIDVAIFHLSMQIKFNDTIIDSSKDLHFTGNPLWLRHNIETNLSFSLQVDNDTSYSPGVWKINLRAWVKTPLPAEANMLRNIQLEV